MSGHNFIVVPKRVAQRPHCAHLARHRQVLGWIDLAGLLPENQRSGPEAVLNGIAYDAAHGRLFVTGKLRPKLFDIEVVPAQAKTLPVHRAK